MLETSRFCDTHLGRLRGRTSLLLFAGFAVASCATPEAVAPPEPTVVAAPALPSQPGPDVAALAQEAKAMLAQAETDIQRARANRALWSRAWESLVLARQAEKEADSAATLRHAKRASELAHLGLGQLAYPPVR